MMSRGGQSADMNVCAQRHLLRPYHDGELNVAAAARFEGHLVDCAPCRAELGRVRAALELPPPQLTVLPSPISPMPRRADDDDSRTMRLAATLVVMATSVMLVGLVWLGVLARESPSRSPVHPVISRSKPADDRAWERVAMTLAPDPLSLPPPSGQQTAAALGEPDLADWMLQGLQGGLQGGSRPRGERTEQP
jgi:hypothetical protein